MMVSYKYPFIPNKITACKLAENLDACRWLYNRLLQYLNDANEKGIKLKTYDSQNMIPSLKLENPKLNLVYSKVLQMVNYILWSNIKGLIASKKNGRKIEGCIKAVIKREGERWFAIVQYEQEPQSLPEMEEAVGLDVGLISFAVDSGGNDIVNPRCAENLLIKWQSCNRV
jgi:putative transposase